MACHLGAVPSLTPFTRCPAGSLRAPAGLVIAVTRETFFCGGSKTGKSLMTFVRAVTMLALAQEALDRCGNNADAAQVYLFERLRSDERLLETLVKSAVEYERQERLHSS